MWWFAVSSILWSSQATSPRADGIEAPLRSRSTAVALVVYEYSRGEEQDAAIMAWRKALDRDGIATWIARGSWRSGEEVRDVLRQLTHAVPPIEGVLLLDDVPTFALHDADHLSRTPRGRPPEPSPRFGFVDDGSIRTDAPYADLDLKLEAVRTSEAAGASDGTQHVRLTVDSPQRVERDLFVGRWSPPREDDSPGGVTRRRRILEFLARSTEAHAHPRDVSRVIAYADTSWDFASLESRAAVLRDTCSPNGPSRVVVHVEQADARRDPRLRSRQILGDPLCSVLVVLDGVECVLPRSPVTWDGEAFHSHVPDGDPISPVVIVAPGFPRATAFSGDRMAFDLIARPGSTTACVLGSDRLEDTGWLDFGDMIGRAQRDEPCIEASIVGDPTIGFRRPELAPTRIDIVRDPSTTDDVLEDMSEAKSPVPYRLGAIRELARRRGAANIERLVALIRRDASPCVRLVALECLARSRAADLDRSLPGTLADPNVDVRLAGIRLMGEVGRAEYLDLMLDRVTRDPSSRVEAALVDAIARYPEDMLGAKEPALVGSVDPVSLAGDLRWLDAEIGLRAVSASVVRARAVLRSLEAADAKLEERIQAARDVRRLRPHRAIGVLLDIARDAKAPVELRKECITTLASYPYSPGRPQVTEALRKLADDAATGAELRDEARRTIRRLDDGPNSPLDP